MKIIVLIMMLLFSVQLHATACKCNCDPADFSICAGGYDLEHPCGNICPGNSPGVTPQITACPVVEVANRYTGESEWRALCFEE